MQTDFMALFRSSDCGWLFTCEIIITERKSQV